MVYKRQLRNFLWFILFFILVFSFIHYFSRQDSAQRPKTYTYSAELEYLKFVHLQQANIDERLAFLLLLEYLNKGRYEEGYQFFNSLLQKHNENLDPNIRSLYLNSLAMLKASEGKTLSLEDKQKLLIETVTLLQEADQYGAEDSGFYNHYFNSLVYAKFPEDEKARSKAIEEAGRLDDQELNIFQKGLMREIYFQIAKIYKIEGNKEEAEKYLKLSRYKTYESPISIFTPFSTTQESGYTAQPKEIREIVPGKVFKISGFGVSDISIIISEDQKEMIVVGSLTQPELARKAYDYFLKKFPSSPKATTAIIIHADWDEVGGYQFFRRLNPDIDFYSSSRFSDSLEYYKRLKVPFNYLYGKGFSKELLDQYRPDILVEERTEVNVGGTDIELIPVSEETDHLFVYLPKYQVLFVGDFIVPFFGSTYFENVSSKVLFQMMDIVTDLNPKVIVYTYSHLSNEWNSVEKIKNLKAITLWLESEVIRLVSEGKSREEILDLNLVPPMIAKTPDLQFAYVFLRQPLVDLIYTDVSVK